MRIRKTIQVSIGLLFAIACFAAVSLFIGHKKQEVRERIVIAVSYDPISAPIFVAHHQGFFRDEGIDATLLMHTTGRDALADMEKGNAQFATFADTVLMFAAMDDRKLVAITTMADSSRHHRVIGLKSRGISGVRDLPGKTIGVPARTSGEFFLYSILLFNGIPFSSVSIRDVAPEKMTTALKSGMVDAVAVWSPTANRIAAEFGDSVAELYEDGYLMTWNLAAPSELARDNPQSILKVLTALLRAEQYMIEHPAEAITITAEACRMDPGTLRQEWSNYRFTLRLGDGLLINLEDQARWAIKMHYQNSGRTPDFRKFIYADALRQLDPAAVSIRGTKSP